jgi:hypothetical protein
MPAGQAPEQLSQRGIADRPDVLALSEGLDVEVDEVDDLAVLRRQPGQGVAQQLCPGFLLQHVSGAAACAGTAATPSIRVQAIASRVADPVDDPEVDTHGLIHVPPNTRSAGKGCTPLLPISRLKNLPWHASVFAKPTQRGLGHGKARGAVCASQHGRSFSCGD